MAKRSITQRVIAAWRRIYRHAWALRFRRLLSWQPLTSRGFLALFLAGGALYFLALPHKDLVAAMLGGGILAVLGLVLATSVIVRWRLASRLQIEARFDHTDAKSRRDLPAGLLFKGSSLPPYFTLAAHRSFARPGVRSRVHLLKGKHPEGGVRHVIDTLYIPHRGLWLLDAVKLELTDALGFTRMRWEFPLQANIEVSAPTISIKPLPIVAASARAGDQLDQARERSGDLFDLKQYDPGDGIKRILWKTYAKSGELVVRRPEPAIIPEGEVAVYLIAGRADDATAGALQHYLDVLEQQQITVLFGTDGLHYQPQPGLDRIEQGADDVGAHGGTLYYCSDRDEIQRAINRSVWSRTVGTGTEFEAFLESLASNNRPVHNVIVFAPAESSPAGTSKEPARDLWLTRLTRSAGHYSVKLSVALVPPALEQPYLGVFTLPAQHRGAPVPGPKFSRPPLQALKEKVLARHAPSAHSAHGLREISAQIGRSGWDLFVVEAYE